MTIKMKTKIVMSIFIALFIFFFSIMFRLIYNSEFSTAECDPASLTKEYTEKQIRNMCGNPLRINSSSYSKQWVYGGGTYIYTEQGHFRSAQWKEK